MTVAVALDHRFEDLELERAVLEPKGIEIRDARGLPPGDALAACAEADAILIGARFRMDAAALATLERCRIIVRYGVGVENIDLDAASERDIWVAYVPDYCVNEVADHALAMLLAINRRLAELDRAVRTGAWGIPAGLEVRRLSESVLGVIGFGRIGQAFGRRGAALGMTVLANDPVRPPEEIRDAGAEPVTLEELLARSDYISLHAPPRADGQPVLDGARLAGVKPGAVVINVARGGLVDEPALIAALRSGAVGAAGLDVAASEPVTASDPLLALDNVVVTPHSAWYSLDAVRELRIKAATEVARVLTGGVPATPANHVSS